MCKFSQRVFQWNVILKSIYVFQNCVARALYDNIAESPDELAFRKGDTLTVLEQNTGGIEGWWLCSLRGRQVRLLLLSFCRPESSLCFAVTVCWLFSSCISHSIPPLVFIVPLLFLVMSYVCTVTRLRAGLSGVRNWARVRNFTLSRLAIPALGPTQLRYRCYFPVTKRLGMMMTMTAELHKAEIKRGWSCTPPWCLHNVDGDNFTFWVLSLSCVHLLVLCHVIFFPLVLYSFPLAGRPVFAFSFSSISFPCSN